MTRRQWLEALEAVSSALDSNVRALRLLLENGHDEPSNVIRDADKTGPRTPFKGELAMANLRRMFDESRSAAERKRLRDIAWSLADQKLITEHEAAHFGSRR